MNQWLLELYVDMTGWFLIVWTEYYRVVEAKQMVMMYYFVGTEEENLPKWWRLGANVGNGNGAIYMWALCPNTNLGVG